MSSPIESLFDPHDAAARRQGLAGLLAADDGAARLERALLDLLDLDDPALLEAAAAGLSPRASDPAARRVLEAISRVEGLGAGPRAAALRALRGDAPTSAPDPAAAPAPKATPAPESAPTDPALSALARAAASPTPEALDDAELALIEVDPDAVDAASCRALADRLEAACEKADEATRPRLERLARELRETAG